jgi:predicted nucleic acid-binding Zn ribbon protein
MDFGKTTKVNLSKTEEKCKQSIGKNMRRKMIPCSYIFAILLLSVYVVVLLYATECIIGS